jgi:hypothetical protein
MDPILQNLVDETAIRNLHLRYCRGIDRMDWDLVRSCFHEDAQADYGGFKGDLDAFMAYAKQGVIFQYTMHFVGNQLVDIDGDIAWAERYTRAFHRVLPTAQSPAMDWNMNLRYIDRLARSGGEWRIVDRVMITEAMTTASVEAVPDFAAAFNVGVRGREDLSYRRDR